MQSISWRGSQDSGKRGPEGGGARLATAECGSRVERLDSGSGAEAPRKV